MNNKDKTQESLLRLLEHYRRIGDVDKYIDTVEKMKERGYK